MGRQPVQVLHVVASQAPVEAAAEALGGLGPYLAMYPATQTDNAGRVASDTTTPPPPSATRASSGPSAWDELQAALAAGRLVPVARAPHRAHQARAVGMAGD